MKILIKQATIIDASSSHHLQIKDLLIENGIITKIDNYISDDNSEIFESDNLYISQGWVDLNARFGEPGHEYKEDLSSGMKSAAQGGFTHVTLMPSTQPCIQTKSDINYLINKSSSNIVDIHPIGALTKNREGNQITEMYDMKKSGAIAFSDDKRSIANASVMKIAMLYTKNFDGLIMSFSSEEKSAKNGQINEGPTSTKLGLSGIPSLAEELQLARDIQLCEYTNSRIHFSSISTSESVNLIRKAKSKGLNITADTTSYHLLLDDSELESFNSNLKVNPPLRSTQDVKALREALKEGVIDAVCSNHSPQNIENKKCEFNLASFGMINLETSFAAANTALIDVLSTEELITKFTSSPKAILRLKNKVIEEGTHADLTLFNPNLKWQYKEDDIVSKSKNSGFLEEKFSGKALAIINNGQFLKCKN